jgi:hypothetical protein
MSGEMRTSVDIDAGPEFVWAVLTDVRAYPEWTPLILSAEGTFAPDGGLTFTFPPFSSLLRATVPGRVLEVTPLRRLRYVLRFGRWGMPGLLDTEHMLTIERRDGGVRLWMELRFSGLLLPMMTRSLNRERAPAFGPMPATLKARIEGLRPEDQSASGTSTGISGPSCAPSSSSRSSPDQKLPGS